MSDKPENTESWLKVKTHQGPEATAKAQSKQVELSPIHDFAGKLRQEGTFERLRDYVRWQVAWRRARDEGKAMESVGNMPDDVPVSINLDLTTACNYRCDHCVDMDILNTGIRFDEDKLESSIKLMAEKGLKSVIVIGGGEPTVHPTFSKFMRQMKSLGLSLGLVTNGGSMDKVLEIADCLDENDWVRLSLDSGSNEVFEAMHKPRKAITLDEICAGVPPVKDRNPRFKLGFSFIIVWDNCEANDTAIHENVHEIEMAAERAKRHRFDYISFKPFLTRAPSNNAEIVGLTQTESRIASVMAEIRRRVDKAKAFDGDGFKVYESTNLKVLENGTYSDYTEQPRNCHMQFFRQVLSPLGLFNCPVYRHVPQAQLGHKHSYSDLAETKKAQLDAMRLIESFDASCECKEVTCLYNHANWYIEDLIQNPEKLETLEAVPDRGDYFL